MTRLRQNQTPTVAACAIDIGTWPRGDLGNRCFANGHHLHRAAEKVLPWADTCLCGARLEANVCPSKFRWRSADVSAPVVPIRACLFQHRPSR